MDDYISMNIDLIINGNDIIFDHEWMKYFSLNIIIKYSLFDGKNKIINHNFPFSSNHDNDNSIKTNKWNRNIIIDSKLFTFSDINYYIYLVPHFVMDYYENKVSKSNCQQITIPSNNILLKQDTLDLLSILSHSKPNLHLILSPFHHLNQIKYNIEQKQKELKMKLLKQEMNINQNEDSDEKEKEQKQDESDQEEDDDNDESMSDKEESIDAYDMMDNFDPFNQGYNQFMDDVQFDSGDNDNDNDHDNHNHSLNDTNSDDDNSEYQFDQGPKFQVFEDDEIDDIDKKMDGMINNNAFTMAQEMIIPAPMRNECNVINWNNLHLNIFKDIDSKCIQIQNEEKDCLIKGYLLNGNNLIIHCKQIDEMKWKINIKISGFKKIMEVDDKQNFNQCLLWRIYHCVGKRVWKYYKTKCVINKKPNKEEKKEEKDEEDEEDDDDEIMIVESNDEDKMLLNELFDANKYKDNDMITFEKYKQECMGLNKYILSKLKSLKSEWNKLYNNDNDNNNDFVMSDELQEILIKVYELYCDYNQKLSQTQF